MRYVLIALLSLNAGYVDATGFLALHGLFPTHVTGNFVTLGAALALGSSGILAKVLALPLFCAVVLASRLVGGGLDRLGWPGLRIMFALEAVLLSVAAGLALKLGPFPNGDAPTALAVGGALVSAMAIQNAVHRVRLAHLPPSTIMTGTTTQVMVDLADLIRPSTPEARAAARRRLGPMSAALAFFALGCGAAAFAHVVDEQLGFLVPPALAFATLIAGWRHAAP
ncbi:YoaK family protein [Methylopila musalis]|uniref:YoaK family protein n=1 Tax=Methylopila musalis TaxID=1134781 RepID=A0ABW3Z980_9HYPH